MSTTCISGCFFFLLLTFSLVRVSRRAEQAPEFYRWLFLIAAPLIWASGSIFFLDLLFAGLAHHEHSLESITGLISGSVSVVLPLAFLPVRIRKYGAVFLSLFFSLLIFSDILFYRFFLTTLSFAAMREAPQLIDWYESVFALLVRKDLYLLFVPLMACYFAAAYKFPRELKQPRRRTRLGGHGLVFLIFFAVVFPNFIVLNLDAQKIRQDRVSQKWGAVNNHLLDLLRIGREKWLTSELDSDTQRKIEEFFEDRARAEKSSVTEPEFGLARGKNLVMIQVESLQQFIIGKKINGQEITPFLNRLRQQALYFPHIFNQTADGSSSDADFAVLNSLYPLVHGAVVLRKPYNRFVALPMLLKSAGYSTFAAQPASPSLWNMNIVYPRYGFQRHMSIRQIEPGDEEWENKVPGDHSFLSGMVSELAKLPNPFFAFLITVTSHYPYVTLPDHRRILDVGHLKNTLLGNYIHSIHYVDGCLEQFFRDLEAAGLLDKTVIAIYGDHDAHLLLNADLRRLINDVNPNLPDRVMKIWLDRIPFFLVVPGSNLRGEMPEVGGHVDMGPTLLHYLGVQQPKCFIGRPLIPERSHIAVSSEQWRTAITKDRMAIAGARKIDCYEFPAMNLLPSEKCSGLVRSADEELEISRLVVLHDLSWEIAGFDNPFHDR